MSSDATAGDVNARDLVALMSADSTAAGGRFYGDSGYSDMVLTHYDELQKALGAALSWKASRQSRPMLPDRLMYGSDWSLLMMEADMRAYFDNFVKMYSGFDATGKLSGKFFGDNAVAYLGLKDGRTRDRLQDFYTKNAVHFETGGQPIWMRKIQA